MIVCKSESAIRKILGETRRKGQNIGFVPTMGALHAGHLSLIHKSVRESDFTVVSIFVNPLQFGPGEDYRRYPRNFKNDAVFLRKAGVDLIFYPAAKAMYRESFSTFVEEESLIKHLCARPRPSHFKGVCTMVAKLFNIVQPATAYFGQKDYQQLKIIQKMAGDLNFPIKIKMLPIVRESDNLAMSSRNAYLNPEQRKAATCLYAALSLAKRHIRNGERNPKKIIRELRRVILTQRLAKIEYIEIVDAGNLSLRHSIEGKLLIALAVKIGRVRLIDNILLNV